MTGNMYLIKISTSCHPPETWVAEEALGGGKTEEVRQLRSALTGVLERAVARYDPDSQYGQERIEHYDEILRLLRAGKPVTYRQFGSDDEVQIPVA